MKRKQLQHWYRLGLIALLGGTSQVAFAQQQPAGGIQRNAVPTGQPQSNQQQANQQQVPQQQAAPAAVGAPFPAIDPRLQKYLDDVLGYWSQQTQAIERYRCDFQRWTYEGDAVHAKFAQGNIRFMKPDKGTFKVEEMYFNKGKDAGGKPMFGKVGGQFGEWWVCDGKILHEFDRTQKKVTRYHLPAEMQGVAIINSPLPFLFGVQAQQVKAKFWLRPIEFPDGKGPKDGDGKPIIVLEAFPRKQIDAQNFQRVRIYLDEKEFLPIALEIFLPNWTEQNDQREMFQFSNREKNWNLLDRALNFNKEFIETTPPKDWTIEDAPAVEEAPAAQSASQPDPAQPKR
jgi:TIGR03009 family protein